MPHDPVSRPRWVRLRESPPSTPDAPDEPEGSPDPWIDSTVLTEDLSILQGLLSELVTGSRDRLACMPVDQGKSWEPAHAS